MQIIQQPETKFWLPIHVILVKNQSLIKKLFLITYIFCILMIPLGFYLFSTNLNLYLLLFKLSGKVGSIALYLFLVTLIPGIFQRFKILPLFSASIVLFRRQIGVLSFYFALIHSSYISTIPAVMSGVKSLDELPSNALTGIVTILILFPVWITSNDISQKKLGRWWKTVQRLTYFAMITIFFHVSLEEKSAALITAIVFTLEVLSWLKVWLMPKNVS